MTPFVRFQGVLAPLLRANIDTDAIIPSREMKRVSKRGLGEGLFAGWRYTSAQSREPSADFILNQPAFRDASILAGGINFGCGSSREHAVWALQEYGIRAVIAPSFGAIFERNAYNNGLLPVRLPPEDIAELVASTAEDPAHRLLEIDLEAGEVRSPEGQVFPFPVPELQREMLLNGWDPIDRTLQNDNDIQAFLEEDQKRRPWVYEAGR